MEEDEYKDNEKVLFKTRGKLSFHKKKPEEVTSKYTCHVYKEVRHIACITPNLLFLSTSGSGTPVWHSDIDLPK